MVSCGMKVVKALLFIFNFIFLVSGIGIIVTGTMVMIKYERYLEFVGPTFGSPPIMLIVVGSIVTIISFFGCCGAIKENYCMTMTYGALLAVILILELAAGISAYVLKPNLHAVIEENMLHFLNMYNKTNPEQKIPTQTWNLIQRDQHCCGVTNFTNWADTSSFYNTSNLPDSCCKVYFKGCGTGALYNIDTVYVRGCLPTLLHMAEENILIIGGVGIGIAFIQVLGIIFTCCLAKAIKSEYEEVP